MQDNTCNIAPIGAIGVGVYQSQIGDDVFAVVGCQRKIGWRPVGDIRIKQRRLHGGPSRRCRASSLSTAHDRLVTVVSKGKAPARSPGSRTRAYIGEQP